MIEDKIARLTLKVATITFFQAVVKNNLVIPSRGDFGGPASPLKGRRVDLFFGQFPKLSSDGRSIMLD